MTLDKDGAGELKPAEEEEDGPEDDMFERSFDKMSLMVESLILEARMAVETPAPVLNLSSSSSSGSDEEEEEERRRRTEVKRSDSSRGWIIDASRDPGGDEQHHRPLNTSTTHRDPTRRPDANDHPRPLTTTHTHRDPTRRLPLIDNAPLTLRHGRHTTPPPAASRRARKPNNRGHIRPLVIDVHDRDFRIDASFSSSPGLVTQGGEGWITSSPYCLPLGVWEEGEGRGGPVIEEVEEVREGEGEGEAERGTSAMVLVNLQVSLLFIMATSAWTIARNAFGGVGSPVSSSSGRSWFGSGGGGGEDGKDKKVGRRRG
ncbi:hypothetical protein HDU67_005548 [Dinochytrium kinnereticum]|nr:hypothetical protein HDU67_005548 [Dinochytrium kinnereticum]